MPSVETLGDRLLWIIDHRPEFGSLRALSLAANLSHSTLSNAVNRERRGEDPNLASTTLAKVAKAAGVPVDWLINGGPAPGAAAAPARVVERDDRYAFAPDVIARLIEDGYDARDARRAVGDVAFQEGPDGSNALDLYRAAKRILDSERGRPEVGVRKVEDNEF